MMSIFNDLRLEAQAVRAEQSPKRGAPLGPRIAHNTATDEDGTYTIFTGKLCRVCACQLTSRTRYGTSTLCTEHGREHDRLRSGARRRSQAGRTRSATTAEALRDPCPHRQAVRSAVTGFLNHPMDERTYAHTLGVMREFELRARLLFALPPSSTSDAPASAQESTTP